MSTLWSKETKINNFLESGGLKKTVKESKICPTASYEGPNGEKEV